MAGALTMSRHDGKAMERGQSAFVTDYDGKTTFSCVFIDALRLGFPPIDFKTSSASKKCDARAGCRKTILFNSLATISQTLSYMSEISENFHCIRFKGAYISGFEIKLKFRALFVRRQPRRTIRILSRPNQSNVLLLTPGGRNTQFSSANIISKLGSR